MNNVKQVMTRWENYTNALIPHFETRTDLFQLHVLTILLVDVMSKRDEVVLVRERHHTLRVHLGHREQKLENVLHAFAQLSVEAVENQVRQRFGNGIEPVFDIMTHDDIAACS